MTTQLLSDKYRGQLDGVLNWYDRIILIGSLHPFWYAIGMTHYLYEHQIRILQYAKFAEPLRDRICENAEELAREHGLEFEFIRQKSFRKEDRIQVILQKRGSRPGLVHIFSVLEPCDTYQPWHDKQTHHSCLRDTAKCLHDYIIDVELGLCYLRVPTRYPFRVQFCFNGHAWLAAQLRQKGVAFDLLDNAFVHIVDYAVANQLVEHFDLVQLHHALDAFAQRFYPVIQSLSHSYQWSISQAQHATDPVS